MYGECMECIECTGMLLLFGTIFGLRNPQEYGGVEVGRIGPVENKLLSHPGPGSPAAAGRRRFADEQERRWRRERQAIVLSERQGQIIVRRGFSKL